MQLIRSTVSDLTGSDKNLNVKCRYHMHKPTKKLCVRETEKVREISFVIKLDEITYTLIISGTLIVLFKKIKSKWPL